MKKPKPTSGHTKKNKQKPVAERKAPGIKSMIKRAPKQQVPQRIVQGTPSMQNKQQLKKKPTKAQKNQVVLAKKPSLKKGTSFTVGSGNIYIPPKSKWPVTIVSFLHFSIL